MQRQFKPDWRMTLLVLLFLPAMISLGFWQLRRADENRSLLVAAAEKKVSAPLVVDAGLAARILSADALGRKSLHLTAIKLHGTWRDQYFILENQLHEGRNGYHVLGVLDVADVGAVLVNRGWIAAPGLRSEFPQVPPVIDGALESGELYLLPQIYEDKPLAAESGWPKRIGRLQLPGLERELQTDVLPVIVRLVEGSPSALTTRWPVVNITPEKNTAYAIQWFAMSAALVICYLAMSFRRPITGSHP